MRTSTINGSTSEHSRAGRLHRPHHCYDVNDGPASRVRMLVAVRPNAKQQEGDAKSVELLRLANTLVNIADEGN
jgi:hypothetical protein